MRRHRPPAMNPPRALHRAWTLLLRRPLAPALTLALASACRGDDGGGDASVSEGSLSEGTVSEGTESTGGTTTGASATSEGSTSEGSTSAGTDTGSGDPLLDALLAIEGMEVEELEPLLPDTRLFALRFQQPADHDDPAGPWFGQELTLFHRDVGAPMVLATTGYTLPSRKFLSEPVALLEGNQIAVEQRFFGASRPDPADWSDLTIAQAAADHHRLVEALRPIYGGAWVSTGASKGGMTSVYHRRFYPDDVDATIAYVAPHSLSDEDPRYEPYIDGIGDPACADALRGAQAEGLARRDALAELLVDYADGEALTFDHLGLDRALEFAVVESRFAFWQYGGEALCDGVPGPASADQELFDWFDAISSFAYFSDDQLEHYGPYFYQAATELGAPRIAEDHLGDLRLFPGEDTAALFSPPGLKVRYDPSAMQGVAAWIDAEGERLLFLYGGRDPWTAGAFPLGGAADSRVYVVADGNHGTKLASLDDAEYDEALQILFAWLGDAAPPPGERALRRAQAQPWPRIGRAP
ncbi:MAG: S28 family serine protease [Nannocystaceae bacterium]